MKTVVVDFSNYDSLCGFGEIVRNFCPRLAAQHLTEIHFVFILPRKHCGEFGDRVGYIAKENFKKEALPYKDTADLWHITDQYSRRRLFGKKSIQLLTVHDLNFLYEKHGIHLFKHKMLFPRYVRRSDYVTVISKFVYDDLKRNVKGLKNEPQIIYNGINDIEKKERKRPAFVKSNDEKFFFTIGQIRKKKNFHILVPMMRYFPNYKLYICGDNHFKYYNEIMSLIRPEDRERILVPGKITDEEKCWLYAHAQAFLFPSKLEGFGIPVLEAMRFGTKVFSSRFSSLSEICSSHATYWDSYEPEAMAKVVSEELKGWQRNGKEALEAKAYSESFNYERYTQEYVALYQKLLGIKP
jgi:glycosyltransferase involved in cell wall biosynthesis